MADEAAPLEGESTDKNQDSTPLEGEPPEVDTTPDTHDIVSRAELKKIRSETASLRRRAKDAEAELEKLRTEQLSESEKAIVEARQEARKEALGEVNQRLIAAEIRAAAATAGAIDTDDVVQLVDATQITVEDDGTIVGVNDVVAALLEAKPHLVRSEPRFTVPGDGGGGASSALPSFTRSQLADNSFYRANEDAIRAALRDGRIIDDRVGQ